MRGSPKGKGSVGKMARVAAVRLTFPCLTSGRPPCPLKRRLHRIAAEDCPLGRELVGLAATLKKGGRRELR
eukprot:9105738-Pyramimonas_sp.AAC.1